MSNTTSIRSSLGGGVGIGFGPNNQIAIYANKNYSAITKQGHIPDLLANALSIPRVAEVLTKIKTRLTAHEEEAFIRAIEKLDPQFKQNLSIATKVDDFTKEFFNEKLIPYLVPAALDQMDEADQLSISAKIKEGLESKDLKGFDSTFFDVEFTHNEPIATQWWNNGGRTILLKAVNQSEAPKLKFMEQEFTHGNTHFHLRKLDPETLQSDMSNTDEREYDFYSSPEEPAHYKARPEIDPNRNIVGEVHSLFSAPSGPMVLAFALKLGEKNAAFKAVLDASKVEEIGVNNNSPIKGKINIRSFISETVGGKLDSWAVPDSKLESFTSGVRFIHFPDKPIVISKEQFKQLETMFGNLQPINPEDQLHHVDRKAGFHPPLNQSSKG